MRTLALFIAIVCCACQLPPVEGREAPDASAAASGTRRPTQPPSDAGQPDARVTDARAGCGCEQEQSSDAGSAPCGCDPVELPKRARAVSIDTHCSSTCALLDSGDVHCWGGNSSRQLGDGSRIDRESPVQVRGLHDVRQLSVSCLSACALLADGSVRCWGALIHGGMHDKRAPVAIPGVSDAKQIASSDGHTCALLTNGSVRCWGNNSWGGLGDGTQTDSVASVPTSGLQDVTRIAGGYGGSYAWTTDGALYAWGSNSPEGELFGDPALTGIDRSTPTLAPRLGKVEQLAAGYAHGCALRADQTVDCWGNNAYGQLGRATDTATDAQPAPVVELRDVVSLGRGFSHTCAILGDASVHCWGENTEGQLGDGTRSSSQQPVPVRDLGNVKQTVGGQMHHCALTTGGAVYCWGDNSHGQLGNGTREASTTPVRVSGF